MLLFPRSQCKASNETREGTCYESGITLENNIQEVDTETIPPPPPILPQMPLSLNDDMHHVYFDIEATGFGKPQY